MQNYCAVILAAGASSRMGRDKALLPWPHGSRTSTLLSAAILALKPFVDAVLVVAGWNEGNIASVAQANGAEVVCNPEPGRGQFSSMQIGLRAALDRGCTAAMITPVDCPPLSAASLAKLCGAFASARQGGAWAVAPEHGGRHGHPLIAGRDLIEAWLSAPWSSNAREVKRAHAQKIAYVAVPEPLLAIDMNTPDEYAAAADFPG